MVALLNVTVPGPETLAQVPVPTAGVLPAITVGPASPATQIPVIQNNFSGTASSNIQWPSKMPADVPVFTYGTITGSSNAILGNIQGVFESVPAVAFNKYQSDLKNAGWAITNATQSTFGFEIDAAKAPRTVVAMFINSLKNGLTGAVTYNDHAGQ